MVTEQLAVVNATGNPRVFFSLPVLSTRTRCAGTGFVAGLQNVTHGLPTTRTRCR
jgi:hypothetical protein